MESRDKRAASELMLVFAERTGLTSKMPPERYLWTDAFAVCNFLGLGEIDLALKLVDQVHHVLGKHRPEDTYEGWISGLPVDEGEQHPTIGGLRIGKKLSERGADEPLDDDLEWDRDGQYFHYLTKWMQALDRASQVTRDARYNVWARELADAAHRAFSYSVPIGRGERRMYWKMSIDLSRPLVASMGHHDPVDGYVACLQLDGTAAALAATGDGPSAAFAAADFRAMIPTDLVTADPLGIGGLLTDAQRLDQLARRSEVATREQPLRDRLLEAAIEGLARYAHSGERRLPADYRLAFRELGLSIGLHGVATLSDVRLRPYRALRSEIEEFWLSPANRRSPTWLGHLNINEVMLATSLAPLGFLGSD